jgi:hypothetical protein
MTLSVNKDLLMVKMLADFHTIHFGHISCIVPKGIIGESEVARNRCKDFPFDTTENLIDRLIIDFKVHELVSQSFPCFISFREKKITTFSDNQFTFVEIGTSIITRIESGLNYLEVGPISIIIASKLIRIMFFLLFLLHNVFIRW